MFFHYWKIENQQLSKAFYCWLFQSSKQLDLIVWCVRWLSWARATRVSLLGHQLQKPACGNRKNNTDVDKREHMHSNQSAPEAALWHSDWWLSLLQPQSQHAGNEWSHLVVLNSAGNKNVPRISVHPILLKQIQQESGDRREDLSSGISLAALSG